MISEALAKVISLNQPNISQSSLITVIKQLYEGLIKVDISISQGNSVEAAIEMKQLRCAITQLEGELLASKLDKPELEELMKILQALKEQSEPDSALVNQSVAVVEKLYLKSSVRLGKSATSNRRTFKRLSILALFPTLVWLSYTFWLSVGTGFELVSHELHWPAGLSPVSLVEPNSYVLSDKDEAEIVDVMSKCYFFEFCPEHLKDKATSSFLSTVAFYKYHKINAIDEEDVNTQDTNKEDMTKEEENQEKVTSEVWKEEGEQGEIDKDDMQNGIVFRSIYWSHHKRIRPITQVSLQVFIKDQYLKGWWISQQKPYISSQLTVEFDDNNILKLGATKPVFNVESEVSYRVVDFENKQEKIRTEKNSKFEVKEQMTILGRLYYYKKIAIFDEKRLQEPLFIDTSMVEMLGEKIVDYDQCIGKEITESLLTTNTIEKDCIARYYKVLKVASLEKLPGVIKRDNYRVKVNYQLLNKKQRSYRKSIERADYFIKEAKSEASSIATGSSMALSDMLENFADIELPQSPEKGLAEIELQMKVNFDNTQIKTHYLNRYLASGGHLEIFGHVENLPSGLYELAVLINNEPVHRFSVEHINIESERYDPQDAQAIWGIEDKTQ